MSRKPLVFHYGINFSVDGQIRTFPAVEAYVATKKKEFVWFILLIDSGATISALPKSDADILGLDYKDGKFMEIYGVGVSSSRGWLHELSIKIGDDKIKLPFVFLENKNAPRILGRAGIFDRFTVVFEEAKRRSGFIKKGSEEANSISNVLDRK